MAGSQSQTEDAEVAVLLLAAGRSRRFGDDKRRALLSSGRTLLSESVKRYVDSGFRVYLCLRGAERHAEFAAQIASSAVEVVPCASSDQGMGATLAEGVQALPSEMGVLVALGDMPCIKGSTLQRMRKKFAPSAIVYPSYENRRGHPVFFGRQFRPELAALIGDKGAADIIRRHAAHCTEVVVDDRGVLLDIDTPEALSGL
ncbi:MAG: nucleotidyltransferase family protein [Pseudomonadota bacterium]